MMRCWLRVKRLWIVCVESDEKYNMYSDAAKEEPVTKGQENPEVLLFAIFL